MNKKELYRAKIKAELDEWESELKLLKDKASKASNDVQNELGKDIQSLQIKFEQTKSKFAEITNASDEAWESIKLGIDTAWLSMKSSLKDAKSKFKR